MLPDRCPVCLSCPVCNVGVLWPNGWMDQNETWHAGRPRHWPHCIRWKNSSPSPERGPSLQFWAHVYCGQTAAWIKMALGTEVGLGPGHIVLDGDLAPLPKKGVESLSPIFGPFLLWPNGSIDKDATWCGRRPRHRQHCVESGTQLSPPKKGGAPCQIFGPYLL